MIRSLRARRENLFATLDALRHRLQHSAASRWVRVDAVGLIRHHAVQGMIFDKQALRLLGKPIALIGLADLPRSAATIHNAGGSGAGLSGSLMPMPCVAPQGRHRTHHRRAVCL